mmetsp:Transcript_4787/g.17666  ORF Transcript_4787/g.17666 Transcript_4787/m.17666 type:complete len:222 (+) Transcript_4787:1774-2439(+)
MTSAHAFSSASRSHSRSAAASCAKTRIRLSASADTDSATRLAAAIPSAVATSARNRSRSACSQCASRSSSAAATRRAQRRLVSVSPAVAVSTSRWAALNFVWTSLSTIKSTLDSRNAHASLAVWFRTKLSSFSCRCRCTIKHLQTLRAAIAVIRAWSIFPRKLTNDRRAAFATTFRHRQFRNALATTRCRVRDRCDAHAAKTHTLSRRANSSGQSDGPPPS